MAVSHPWQIDVAVDSTLDSTYRTDLSDEWTRRVVQCALDAALPDSPPGQVSVLLTDDSTVRQLNMHYRGLDETTDVLSFSSEFPGHWEGRTTLPPLTSRTRPPLTDSSSLPASRLPWEK